MQVVNYWAETGISGFTVYKFRLKRLEGQPTLTTAQVLSCACVTKLFALLLELHASKFCHYFNLASRFHETDVLQENLVIYWSLGWISITGKTNFLLVWPILCLLAQILFYLRHSTSNGMIYRKKYPHVIISHSFFS